MPGTDTLIGQTLSHYRILESLGAGGMGVVYRARDARLGRDVAIKVLPAIFADDPDRLRRFEQEARAVAALNHPNILSVHDTGVHDGVHFIVTELLHGKTLRQELESGPLSARRATEYAFQLAQGLAAAHDLCIVHRDLKPENLFINKDGHLKILDFGLAKQLVLAPPGHENATTLADTAQTTTGSVLGTVAYMSPEQVQGKIIDHRTDIFAFGAVLYEMLTGQRAFHRNSVVETMNAILKEDPSEFPVTVERQIPQALERVALRCLAKDPQQRFQSAKDLGFALDSISAGTVQLPSFANVPSVRNLWRIAALALAVSFVVVGGLLGRALLLRPQPPEYQRLTFQQGYLLAGRFTPDGQRVVYSAAWGNPESKLYSARLDGTEQRVLDLPSADLLAVSRTGDLAVTLNSGTLARVPHDGGGPRELLDHVDAADWSPDDAQLAVGRRISGKSQLEYPIGKPLYGTIGWIAHLRFSPRGDVIAFVDHPLPGDDRGSVAMVDLQGHTRTLTKEWEGIQGLAWSPDGSEVWFTASFNGDWNRHLYAVTRSGKLRTVLQVPAPLYLEDIAPDGRVLLQRQDRRYEVTLAQVGGETRQLSWLDVMLPVSVSRDGRYVVICDYGTEANYRVYLASLEGAAPVLLGQGVPGGISPENKWVASIVPSDTTKIELLPTGSGETRKIGAPNFHYHSASWTSDGKGLIVSASESDGPIRSWLQNIDGSAPRPITPQGVDGFFLTVNHIDYVCARDSTGTVLLYPINGGQPRVVPDMAEHDEVIGGSIDSEVVYVSTARSYASRQVVKLNIKNGHRQSFVTVSPTDAAGVTFVGRPIFTRDEKRYVYLQVRELSVLYVASGLK